LFINSAAELFRLNTGRTLIKTHQKGKDGKMRVASTASIVEAAATKLTDLHNSKQSSGGLSRDPSSSSNHLQDQQNNSTGMNNKTSKGPPASLVEKDFSYKGSRLPFTSQHFESDTQQWRLIFLFHNFLDVEVKGDGMGRVVLLFYPLSLNNCYFVCVGLILMQLF
jgi:hypothetical protein